MIRHVTFGYIISWWARVKNNLPAARACWVRFSARAVWGRCCLDCDSVRSRSSSAAVRGTWTSSWYAWVVEGGRASSRWRPWWPAAWRRRSRPLLRQVSVVEMSPADHRRWRHLASHRHQWVVVSTSLWLRELTILFFLNNDSMTLSQCLRRAAKLALQALYNVTAYPSVCPFVSPSVTRRYVSKRGNTEGDVSTIG